MDKQTDKSRPQDPGLPKDRPIDQNEPRPKQPGFDENQGQTRRPPDQDVGDKKR